MTKKTEKKKSVSQPDEPISFAQLMIRDGSDALEDELQKSLMAAVSGKIDHVIDTWLLRNIA